MQVRTTKDEDAWRCDFVFGEGGVWTEQPDGSWRSGATADGSENSASMTVNGPGTVSFRWKVSCEDYFVFRTQRLLLDYLSFRVDGKELGFINGETGWTNRRTGARYGSAMFSDWIRRTRRTISA